MTTKRHDYLTILICGLESFFTSWALMKAGRMEPGNIFTGVFFLLSFFFYRQSRLRLQTKPWIQTPAARRTALATAVLFALLYLFVDYGFYVETLTSRLFRLGMLAAVFAGFVILFDRLLLLIFSYSCHIAALNRLLFYHDAGASSEACREAASSEEGRPAGQRGFSAFSASVRRFYSCHSALCGFLLCMVCWLPYFLYQYPGIMTPDSINQFEQVLGIIPYSNHHPLVHTLLFQLFYRIGFFLTSDMVTAVSFYTFFQMCFMAFTVSYLLKTLRLFHTKPVVLLLITLFYALVPYHAVYSVTLWKDIPFAGLVLLFGCCMLRLSRRTAACDLILFFVCGTLICLMRSNGWYGFLVSLPLLLYHYRKKAGIFFPALLGMVFTAFVIKYPVMNSFHVIQPDLVESLAIPTQQIAAVLCKDRELTTQQRQLIEKVVDLTYIKELYNPTYADNIKELVRAGDPSYLASHKRDFLSLYLTLGMTYPGDYLTAYRDQTYGYWYPDSFYPVAEAEGVSATSLGVSHTPLIGGPVVIKAKEISLKLGSMLPIYSLLWSMGVAFWFFIICAGTVIIRKEREKLIYYVPGFALYLTVLAATPVATEFRYVYFLIFSLPFYAMVSLIPLQEE